MPCFPSLARAEKKLLRLAGGVGSKSRRGFPPTYRSARETKRPLWPPQGKQNGHYGRHKGNKRVVTTPQGKQKGIMAAAGETKGSLRLREGNKRALWPPHGEQKGRYAPVGVRPPPPLRGSSPCEAGQSIPAGFDCDIQKFVKAGTLYPSIPSIRFSRWC